MDDLIERLQSLRREIELRWTGQFADNAINQLDATIARIEALEASVSHWMGEAKRLLQAGQDGLDRIAALEAKLAEREALLEQIVAGTPKIKADNARLMGLVPIVERFVDQARVGFGNKAVTRSARVNCPAGIYHDARATLAKIKEATDAE